MVINEATVTALAQSSVPTMLRAQTSAGLESLVQVACAFPIAAQQILKVISQICSRLIFKVLQKWSAVPTLLLYSHRDL
ncbi:hypothetical protein Y032_0093g2675 [Ancylostoma ceylanicum]|uniref:Uncharacterized protein n=1 Tax=Ancylostoma ceylanicum TaxID=53326 RepID=A0A016TM49_9BILA|nr:hypothetical protein Y032_0093g2675 [Ancylostoma ceylanicum]